MIFYENSKKRSKIIRSSFLRNKSLLAEIFFKVYYYFCMSFSVFLISSGMTFEIIGSPLRWPIIITATAIPIIVVVFEIIFKIKEHMDHFDSNPSVWIKTTDEFVYSFFRKIKRTGETIEVRYKTKFRDIEKLYVDETKSVLYILAPFNICDGEDITKGKDDALFIYLVFEKKDELLYLLEHLSNKKKIELLK